MDSVDQTVPQRKRELLRQMSSPRDDDKERLNRKVFGNANRTSNRQSLYGESIQRVKGITKITIKACFDHLEIFCVLIHYQSKLGPHTSDFMVSPSFS